MKGKKKNNPRAKRRSSLHGFKMPRTRKLTPRLDETIPNTGENGLSFVNAMYNPEFVIQHYKEQSGVDCHFIIVKMVKTLAVYNYHSMNYCSYVREHQNKIDSYNRKNTLIRQFDGRMIPLSEDVRKSIKKDAMRYSNLAKRSFQMVEAQHRKVLKLAKKLPEVDFSEVDFTILPSSKMSQKLRNGAWRFDFSNY